jgi:hypothetical protein
MLRISLQRFAQHDSASCETIYERDWNGEVILVLDTNDEDERELFGSVKDLGQVVSSP